MVRESYGFLEERLLNSVKNGGKVKSTLYAIFFDKGELRIMPVDMDQAQDAEDRRLVGAITGKMLAEQKKDVYAFAVIAEAWKRKEEKRVGEMFISIGKDKNGKTNLHTYTISRPKTGVVQVTPQDNKIEWLDWGNLDKRSDFPLLNIAWESYRLFAEKK